MPTRVPTPTTLTAGLRAAYARDEDWHAIIADFGERYSTVPLERMCTIYLNGDRAVVSARETEWGNQQSVLFPMRTIVADALALDCRGLVLAHNHPSGEPRPSRADIEITRTLARALTALEIEIADHVIVSRNGNFSFRAAGLL